MKDLSVIAVLITCVVSFFLLRIDSESELGILNKIEMEKVENSHSQDNSDGTKPKEEKDDPLKHARASGSERGADNEKSEVSKSSTIPPAPLLQNLLSSSLIQAIRRKRI